MARRSKFRSALGAGVLGLALIAGGCSSSSDPDTWAEAKEEGNVRQNFQRACTEANLEGGNLTDDQVSDYCGCAYEEMLEHFSDDFEGFKDLEKELRNDPTAVPIEIERLFEQCAANVG